MARNVVIVVDMQNDFITGPLGSKLIKTIVPDVVEFVEERKAVGDKIIFTRDTHNKDDYNLTVEGQNIPIHCIEGTNGWEIIPELKDLSKDSIIINKSTFGFLDWKSLITPEDDGIIILVGVCTDICVISNALILRSLFPEKRIFIHTGCTLGTSIEKSSNAISIADSNLIEKLY